MDAELMTVEEVAERLRMKKSWVYRHADELGVYRLGKYRRFSWRRVIERLEKKDASPARSTPSGEPATKTTWRE
jgi:excisionase family DNA binding protein